MSGVPTASDGAPAVRTVPGARDGMVELVLDRPRGNVLTAALMEELDAALAAQRDRADLRLVVLRGAGGDFSFGASVEEHRAADAPRLLATFHRLARHLAAFPVPVAALVQGRCLGGAFEAVLCCHLVFATAGATFGTPEIRLGVFPPVMAAWGPARLGAARAERMLLTGETLSAADGLAAGFVTAVFGDDADDEMADWYGRHLEPLSAHALRQGVKALRETSGALAGLDRALAAAEAQYLAEVVPSHDGNEGIEAFLAHRPPDWRHR